MHKGKVSQRSRHGPAQHTPKPVDDSPAGSTNPTLHVGSIQGSVGAKGGKRGHHPRLATKHLSGSEHNEESAFQSSSYALWHDIVEVPIPEQDSVGNLQGTGISIKLGSGFDQAGTEFRSGRKQ